MSDIALNTPVNAAVAEKATTSRFEARVLALDGLRGFATLAVVISHYFGEVPHGLAAFMGGWIAVDIFFVLSGYLVGKLILERKHSSNFFAVFYMRRLCRTFPSYILVTCLVFMMFGLVDTKPEWMQYKPGFSVWSYLTFTQNFQMAFTNQIGPYWLAPYWTLAVEEHFYLIGPAFLVFAPRRWLLPILGFFAVFAVAFRYVALYHWPDPIIADAILPGRMDTLILGILAAILVLRGNIQWEKYDLTIRLVPMFAMIAVILLHLAHPALSKIFGHFVLGIGAASFILMIVRDLPEAQRFKSKFLCFFADISYATYLTHIAVLGLMHGLFLGTTPDIDTPAKIAVTLLALPAAFATGWAITRFVEAPFNAYGRSWKWKE